MGFEQRDDGLIWVSIDQDWAYTGDNASHTLIKMLENGMLVGLQRTYQSDLVWNGGRTDYEQRMLSTARLGNVHKDTIAPALIFLRER